MTAHILIVEDEAALVELLRYNLEKEGYRVTVAVDGEEGLSAIEDSKPDLVILDWFPGSSFAARSAASRRREPCRSSC
jgi:two-component system phosphate regulon response regulator PhoB